MGGSAFLYEDPSEIRGKYTALRGPCKPFRSVRKVRNPPPTHIKCLKLTLNLQTAGVDLLPDYLTRGMRTAPIRKSARDSIENATKGYFQPVVA